MGDRTVTLTNLSIGNVSEFGTFPINGRGPRLYTTTWVRTETSSHDAFRDILDQLGKRLEVIVTYENSQEFDDKWTDKAGSERITRKERLFGTTHLDFREVKSIPLKGLSLEVTPGEKRPRPSSSPSSIPMDDKDLSF